MIIPILISVVLALVIGTIWYGPLFGKHWMRIIGEIPRPTTAQMSKLIGLQAISTLVFVTMLYFVIQVIGVASPVQVVANTLFIWFGMVLPVVAGDVLWNGKSARLQGIQFLLVAGGQLVTLLGMAAVFILFAR